MNINSPETTLPAQEKEWFAEWFDSPYYDILYSHRDETEAHHFIDSLLATLHPFPGAKILDLACGKGRFARYLAHKGFEVTGLDLSTSSISFARQFEAENLSFYTHDMRLPFRTNYFDYVFNFFTSFGYFEREKDELNTLKSVFRGLKPGGAFGLDFFNPIFVQARLLGDETKTIQGIRFDIHKAIEGNRITKTIRFSDDGRHWFFKESVRLITFEKFAELFSQSGFQIQTVFGDYHLRAYHPETSPRLIIVATKP